jgi:hypothetical protein
MRKIEINSDKTTVLGVIFVLALALLGFIGNLYGLLAHRPTWPPRLDFGLMVGAMVTAWAAVMFCRDSKIRRAYPYGVAGLCLYAGWLFVAFASQWAKISVETQSLLGMPMTVLNMVSSGLILGEGVRWFRSKVKLAEDGKPAEEKSGSDTHA